ncbi:cytochrome P450 [Xylariomycetidae sp. FL0641]|nr:cytochrome P450 [Xylariomycetidae sp. FL0641]
MLLPFAVAGLALLISYLYNLLRYKRFKQYAHLPQMQPSLALGNLKAMGEMIRAGPPNGHPDLAFAAMNEALGRPPLMLADLRPFGPAMVVVRSHEVAEQISRASRQFPHSLPKMPEVFNHMIHVTGPTAILAANGEEWKQLRKRFNPGFAPQHLITFLPCILDKASSFLDHLDRFAQSNQSFSLVQLSGNLTFDIICGVVMDRDFGAQDSDRQNEFLRAYHELFQSYASEQVDLPWYLTPRTEWKRKRLANRIRATLRAIVREAYADQGIGTTKSRSILALSIADDARKMSSQAVDEACDQLNTFLFAGHDTTSVLLSWAFYELFRNPRAQKALCDELDEIFGPDSSPATVRDHLLSDGGQGLLHRMSYTSAVIKETLRLWPPAGTARMTKPGAGITVHTSGGEYRLEGVDVYNCATLIQRDPAVYGETADDFVPERWLPGSSAAREFPHSAWRAFERGPRSCVGQELALLEARVVLALVARRYAFAKVGRGEPSLDGSGRLRLDAKGRVVVASEMYPTRQVTPKPVDGMMMRVEVRS